MCVNRRIGFEYVTCGWGSRFESGKKKLRIQKYPVACGQGLRLIEYNVCAYFL